MRLTEEAIIDLFRPMARHAGAFGLLDDCAVIGTPPGAEIVLKTDAIVGGVHFLFEDPADLVARKALRVNLSDLAAKGAEPLGFLVALALPEAQAADWVGDFARGLAADADAYACPLLGGDTVRTDGPVTIAIAAFGSVPEGAMVRRAGARPGDRILVSGSIGDAALGLRLCRDPALARQWGLSAAQAAHLVQRYRLPQPRNALAETLRRHAHAAMDVSDGLVGDLAKLCRASGVSAAIAADRVPLSAAARLALAADPTLLDAVLTGGDDYEILATVPPYRLDALVAAAARAGVALTEIGHVRTMAGDVVVRGADGSPLSFRRGSYSHF